MSYKIVVVGDGGVGKSTFIKRHRTGQFEPKYIATMGVDAQPLTFYTNHGPIVLKMWDCAGQEKFGGLREGYYHGAQGAIVMFDLNIKSTCDHVPNWIQNVRSVVPDIPVIICGNKYDSPDKKISGRIEAQDLPNVTYYEVSARSNYNFEEPFLDLIKKLTGREDLKFEQGPAIYPTEVPLIITGNKGDLSHPPWQILPNPSEMEIKCSVINKHRNVCWVNMPGGVMKVTYEFYPKETNENESYI